MFDPPSYPPPDGPDNRPPYAGGYPQQQWHGGYGNHPQQGPYYGRTAGPPMRVGQSRFGYAGIVCAVLTAVSYVGVLLLAMSMLKAGLDPENSSDPRVVGLGLVILVAMALNLLGLVLSALGFIETTRGRTTVWVGIALNSLPCVGCAGLLALGFIGQAMGIQ